MFIKVFVPNSRGKIELTVEELEELLSEACEKAVREKCATCNRDWYGTGVTYLSNGGSGSPTDWTKITCSSECADNARIQINGQSVKTNNMNSTTLTSAINDMIGE
jgi:hypothetical protein